ncbi:MAG: Gfo/Idh/MocA family oxidoreductase [Verrucomicrobia bacterium]|nr:Gfo/Idh/MocA family oxidoreductase [Verrucomicrobiota bacterium]
MTELKGAMIGAGYFAGFQAEGWSRIPGARIVAVADSIPGRAKEFAERWKIPRAYLDAQEMLANEKPDFIDIATRPESHLQLTSLAAAMGAHVICQKPMAPTWEESLLLTKTCQAAGVRLMIHENWRWQPWYREIKRLLDRNLFGDVFHLSFQMRTGDGRGPEPYTGQPYFRQMERFLVYEVAVHFLDTFRFLVGEIDTIFCQTDRVNPVIRGEDYSLTQLRFANGCRGLIDANRISGPLPVEVTLGTLRLEGDRAMVRLSPDGRLWLTEYGCDEKGHEFPSTDQGYKGDSVRATQQHFIECLRLGQPCESEGVEYLKTVAAVFACYRSAQSGHVISPSSHFLLSS